MKIYSKDGNKIFIPAVKDKGVPIQIKDMTDIKLIYATERGVFEFVSLDMRLVKLVCGYAYEVQSDFKAKRNNRRGAFRVFIGDDLDISILDGNKTVGTVRGVLKDVSAIGMSVVVGSQIEDVMKIKLCFNVNNKTSVNLVGDIVRTQDLGNKRYLYGCKFDERSEVLGKVLLNRQLDYRRRGVQI